MEPPRSGPQRVGQLTSGLSAGQIATACPRCLRPLHLKTCNEATSVRWPPLRRALEQSQTRKLRMRIVPLCSRRWRPTMRGQDLLAESAVLSSLAAFGHRVRQSTWGLELTLYHQGECGIIKGTSISAKCCAALASVCTAWKACVTSLVVGGAELRVSHTEETATLKALLYYCRKDTSERLDIICSGAVSRALAL